MYKILKYCRSKTSQTLLLLFYIIFWQTGIYQILNKDNYQELNTQIQRTDTVFIEAGDLLEEYSLNNSVSIKNKIKNLLQLKYEQKLFQVIIKVSENNIAVINHTKENESELKTEEGYYTGSIPRSPPHLT